MDSDDSGHRDLSPQDWKQSIISAGMIHPSFSSSGGRIELIWYFNYYKLRHCCSIKHCRNRATMKWGGDHKASLTSGWQSHKYKSWTFYCYRIRTPQPPHLWHLHSNKHEHFPSAKLTKHKTHNLKVIRHPRHRHQEASDKGPQLPSLSLSICIHPHQKILVKERAETLDTYHLICGYHLLIFCWVQ